MCTPLVKHDEMWFCKAPFFSARLPPLHMAGILDLVILSQIIAVWR